MARRSLKRVRNPEKDDRMLSVEQICEEHGFHPNTVRSWAHRDGLKFVRHGRGGKMYFKRSTIEKFVKQWYEWE